jgi:hypothetical protein
MKTYIDNETEYFFDTNIRLWTVFKIDKYGHQDQDEADHYVRKSDMLRFHPEFKFTPEEKYLEKYPREPFPFDPNEPITLKIN